MIFLLEGREGKIWSVAGDAATAQEVLPVPCSFPLPADGYSVE